MPKCLILELLGSSNQDVQNKFNQFNFGGGKSNNFQEVASELLKRNMAAIDAFIRNNVEPLNIGQLCLCPIVSAHKAQVQAIQAQEKLGGGTEVEMSQADITKGWENGTKSPISALQALTEILSWDANYRADHKDKLVQTVEDLCKHVMEGKIDENLYTEENLILLNDIFDMCCMENDSSDITDVMQYISDYWYQMVRKIDLAERKTLADGKEDFNEGPQAKRPRKMRTDLDN